MAHQFVFTSLDKTLGGGPGFGIVGISPGFPESLRTRAMSMVSYEGSQTGSSAALPVNWFGQKIDAVSRTWFVLGRIGPAPKDYSGRRNHIAHLLFLDPSEAASVHPACVLREFEWVDSWKGPARPLPMPVLTGNQIIEPISREWLRLTGDGGYAGAAWDSVGLGKCMAFVHEGLDEAVLKNLMIETLSQAPIPDAWRLRFATLAGDFTEGKQSDLAGAVQGSRLAELWQTQHTPHIHLGSGLRILPKANGPSADAARSGHGSVPSQKRQTNPTARTRPTANLVQAEPVAIAAGFLDQSSSHNLRSGTEKPPTPPDPMRLLVPGAIGFFLGMLFTGALVGLGMYSFMHLRDQAQIAQAEQKPAENGEQKAIPPEDGQIANAELANKAPDKVAPPNELGNAPIPPKDSPKTLEVFLKRQFEIPWSMAKSAVGFFSHEPLPPPEIEAQARMIRKLKNMQGWSATEKDLIRADRVWELSRILQTATPPLADPFTHERLDKLTSPEAEDAWIAEAAGMAPFGKREFALAYLSLVANRERVQVRVKKIADRNQGGQTLAPHLDKLKEILDLYKNH